MSRRGWMTSILKTPFFCHRFNTRTILLWGRQIQKRERTTPRKSAEHFQTSSFSSHPVLYGAVAEVLKSPRNIFGESWSKHILICSKLVSGLSDDGVHHVKTCYFILRLTLWGKNSFVFWCFLATCWGETELRLHEDLIISPSWWTFPLSGPRVYKAEEQKSKDDELQTQQLLGSDQTCYQNYSYFHGFDGWFGDRYHLRPWDWGLGLHQGEQLGRQITEECDTRRQERKLLKGWNTEMINLITRSIPI